MDLLSTSVLFCSLSKRVNINLNSNTVELSTGKDRVSFCQPGNSDRYLEARGVEGWAGVKAGSGRYEVAALSGSTWQGKGVNGFILRVTPPAGKGMMLREDHNRDTRHPGGGSGGPVNRLCLGQAEGRSHAKNSFLCVVSNVGLLSSPESTINGL